jgi:hypothetical protein
LLGFSLEPLLGFSLEPLLGFSLADESVYSLECGRETL